MPIAIVSVPVSDAPKARDWYVNVMGLDLLRESPMGPDMTWIQLQPNDGGPTIALVTWFNSMPPGSQQGLMLHVADVDAEHARLTAAGVACTPVGAQPWGRATMLSDPDGNGWVVAQLTHPEEISAR